MSTRSGRPALSGRNSVTLSVDLSSVEAMLDGMADDAEAAARPAAQAAAQVLYETVLRNVNSIRKVTGNLASSIYQVYSQSESQPGKAVYQVSWNHKKAPHGHLVEWGHLQRYEYYKGNDGQIRPMVRPGMEGMPKPPRRATQAVKDAYYVPREGGPVQVAARPFIRPATAMFPQAADAAEAELLRRINGGGDK